MSNGISVKDNLVNLIAKIGEKITIRRANFFDNANGSNFSYVHSSIEKGIGKIVSVVKLDGVNNGKNDDIGSKISMHIAASNPLAISPEEISEEIINKEKEIIEAQVSDADKPPEIIEKMTSGRLKKFLSEVSLINQPFVKDPSLNVSVLLKNDNNSVLSFIRYEVGEGIEVEKKDFAEEVQAQLEN